MPFTITLLVCIAIVVPLDLVDEIQPVNVGCISLTCLNSSISRLVWWVETV